jgi:hypothetical protein
MKHLNLVTLANQEMAESKAGAHIDIGDYKSCGCACVNDFYDENGQWDYTHTTSNHQANWDALGADGWGAWSPEMWHLRKPPHKIGQPLL